MAFIAGFFVAIILAAASIALRLMAARYKAARDNLNLIPMFFGLVHFATWKPNEAIVILKNGRVKTVEHGQGGTLYVFPILGERIQARVELGDHLVTWHDSDGVLTREGLKVGIKLSMWWCIREIEKYVFSVAGGVHIENEHVPLSKSETAEEWLQNMIENTLRPLISQASVTQLVSTNASTYLNVEDHHGMKSAESVPDPIAESDRNITSAFERELLREISEKMEPYGVSVSRIEFQDISLPAEVQKAIHAVWTATLLPAQTEQEMRAEQIKLERLKESLGGDTVALDFLLKNLKGTNIGYVPPFLAPIFDGVQAQANSSISNLGAGGSERALAGNGQKSLPDLPVQNIVACPNCGAAAEESAKFCMDCGQEIPLN